MENYISLSHWGFFPILAVVKDEPEVQKAKQKEIEKLLFPIVESEHLDLIV